MSTAAFTITQFGITIITDGRTYNQEGETLSTNYPKVCRLSDGVALIWLGWLANQTDDIISHFKGRRDAEGIISEIHEILESGLDETELSKITGNGTGISTLSYENGVATHRRVQIRDGKFTRHFQMHRPPTNACIMVDCDNPEWPRFLKEASRAGNDSGDPIEIQEEIVYNAFENMLEYHKDNKFIGGQIFIETITP